MASFLLVLFTLTPINRLGIMSAMDVELDLLKESMRIAETDTLAQRIFNTGILEGMECVCVKAGIGKVNAALTAEILILKYDVNAVIYTGVAGGINPELKIGDIIISRRIIHHDFGQITPDGFISWDTLGFFADSFLVDVAVKAANNVKFDSIPHNISKEKSYLPHVKIGCVVTGDQFIASEEKRQWIENTFHADCVEMEGAAVAQVCTINKIPFVIIRSLCDLANEEADLDFEAFVVYAAKNSSLIVKEIIKLLNEKSSKY
ncbi:5'-methylthioadenosine/adenosylhomocysteine nucleosidase [candidate division WOR-3 bacterium]|nr:5'-methylthioadenosine/adenosylhomocysteine nucleosidase [candidate division WOR-3 bacterium]